MTVPTAVVADAVARYATRLHSVAGSRQHVASPLGAWLLLALAAPASQGGDRDLLTEVLGCDVDVAADAAAELLADRHPLVGTAAAVWTARSFGGTADFRRWLAALPPAVSTGELPDQASLDIWARDHTFGLIPSFPLDVGQALLVLATALATKVSWELPFDLVPAAELGADSPWTGRLHRALGTPSGPGARGHRQFIAPTPDAGDVIVHAASAADGLLVVSVGAMPTVPAGRVLAAAHVLGHRLATGARLDVRDLASLPLGTGPLWRLREIMGSADICSAVLPAWSISSEHDLAEPALGFAAACHALAPGPWQARQAAAARYSRTGFEAAAVTSDAIRLAARVPARHRAAELRFGHPFATVAFATDPAVERQRSLGEVSSWHGLPVFSAWVTEPVEPDELDDASDEELGRSGRQA